MPDGTNPCPVSSWKKCAFPEAINEIDEKHRVILVFTTSGLRYIFYRFVFYVFFPYLRLLDNVEYSRDSHASPIAPSFLLLCYTDFDIIYTE